MKPKPLPPIEVLRALLDYDPKTGVLKWRERSAENIPPGAGKKYASLAEHFNRTHAGEQAFKRKMANGYLSGVVLDKPYLAHRVAFAHYHGFEPDHVDHINGDKSDNRIINLRSVTKKVNSTNRKVSCLNKTGVTGVMQVGEKWAAYLKRDSKMKFLGRFDTLEAAAKARSEECARHGYIDRYG